MSDRESVKRIKSLSLVIRSPPSNLVADETWNSVIDFVVSDSPKPVAADRIKNRPAVLRGGGSNAVLALGFVLVVPELSRDLGFDFAVLFSWVVGLEGAPANIAFETHKHCIQFLYNLKISAVPSANHWTHHMGIHFR